MRVNIFIRKQRVMYEAGALCAYVARTLGNEQAQLTDYDTAATAQIWNAGVASMETTMREWLGNANVLRHPSEDWHGELEMPENFELAVTDALEATLLQYLVQYVTWKWLALHAPDAAGTYETGATDALAEANVLLATRHRPEEEVIVRRCGRVNRALIVIDTESVLLHVRSKAWVVADMTGIDEGESRHQTADIGSASNKVLLLRDIDLAWHELEDIFFALTDHDECCEMKTCGSGCCERPSAGVDLGVVDNSAPHVHQYELRLLLPVGVTESTVRYWRTLMHEYLVAYALQSWLGIVNPDRQGKFLADLDRLRSQIRSSMTRRTTRVHRPGRPF